MDNSISLTKKNKENGMGENQKGKDKGNSKEDGWDGWKKWYDAG